MRTKLLGRPRGRIKLLSALALGGLAGGGCGESPPPSEPLRPVRAEIAYARGGSRVRTFSGTAHAGQETELSFRVPGTVERIPVRVGQSVASGQLIAQLETEDFELAVQQAEANLSQSQASTRKARADLERVRGLYENDNVSRADLDAAEARFDSDTAQVDSAEKALESARRQFGYASLRAPVAGLIAAVEVEVNENVGQGQTVVLLTSGSRPEVEVAMPESLIGDVREGAAVTVTFDALTDPSGKPVENDGVVTEVGVAATGTATTFPVTVRLTRDNREIRSGMAANVAFRFGSRDGGEAIYLPAHAVGQDREGNFVFVLEPDGTDGVWIVRRRSVEIRPELTPDGLQILAGLDEGERVVTAGVRRLRDGQPVTLLDGGAPG